MGDQRLERKIGWIQGATVNVNYIIGAGIFVGPALTLQLVGSGAANLIIWTIGAFVAFSGTFTFMELGTMKTKVSLSLFIYYVEPYESIKWCSISSFNCHYPYCFKYLFYKVLPSDVDPTINLSFYGTSNSIGPYASALYYVMNSYSGWHNLNYILDEDPIKNLPKASSAAILSTATLYILTNIAYLVVLPLDTMKSSEFIVAAAFFTRSLGENFVSTVLPLFIGLSAFGCGAAINFSAGRVIMEVSRQGLLPYGHLFGKVNPRFKSPVNAYLLQYILSILFIFGPPPGAVYQFVVAFAAYPVYVFYFLMALAILILRKREPKNNRPIKAPLVPYITAIFSMVVCTGFWYYQIVIRNTPGKSYNESIRDQGQAAIEQEIFNGYTSVPTEAEP
ncbi:hypothetical protein RO3G_16276 [Rhizopus delemar RA 99-880]|uniref:Uncharacterized protein n=1 Tax=Rhizopus delemar (strain RA 99-880 / ATCC MYA-4621 / FGSC 9543 / NRRL 43880) TaxID=246409 RepID=I1CSY5_RHIO9|nr:hypothetical protein RO3G_16276 [Rhizopus delemar RA 99-880]|eukprot:EIE91565.1 hypothetical protein RO3G_16276 [Rhizopus delemar RA 99-880]